MAVIRGHPERLEDYTGRTRARVAQSHLPLGDYQQALTAFNAAPNDLGGGLPDRAGVIGAHLDALSRLDRQPAAFAWALRELDAGWGYPRYDGTLATSFTDLFDALAAARADDPLASDAAVTRRALRSLADRYARRLDALAVEEAYPSQWDPASAEQTGELAAVFEQLALTSHRHPELADLVVARLGARGVHEVLNGLRVHAESWRFSDTAGTSDTPSPYRVMTAHLANTLRIAARDGGVDQRLLDDVTAADAPGDPLNVALLLAAPNATWPDRFLQPAVRTVFDAYTAWPVSHLDRLAGELFDGDARQGALHALARNPAAAWDLLGDEAIRDEVLFGTYNDEGAAAGAVLRAGLHDHVAASADPRLLAAARERFDTIAHLVYDEDEAGWAIFGRGDQLTTGAREGLAWAMLPHLHSMTRHLAEHDTSDERTHWQRTLAKVLADETAASVVARGYGVYLAAQYAQGARNAGQTPGGEADKARMFIVPAADVGELAVLIIDAEGTAVGEHAARSAFFIAAGEAAAKTAAGVGIAASPLTVGTSIAVGGGASFVIGQLVDQIPVQEYDARSAAGEHRDAYLLTAVRVIAADDTLAEHVGISPGNRATLADDAFIDAYLRGDKGAEDEYKEILDAQRGALRRWATDIRNATMGPFITRVGGG